MTNKRFLYQAEITAKIWLMSCVLNAAFGLLFETIFIDDLFAGGLVTFALLLIVGVIYSFPVFVCMLIFINRSVFKNKSGKRICNGTYLIAGVMTFVMCLILAGINGSKKEIGLFMIIIATTELCAMLGIITYHKSLKNLGVENRISSVIPVANGME